MAVYFVELADRPLRDVTGVVCEVEAQHSQCAGVSNGLGWWLVGWLIGRRDGQLIVVGLDSGMGGEKNRPDILWQMASYEEALHKIYFCL